jgi:putative phage-type endonuclease
MALTVQQRKDRRLGVGGSDIAALFGVLGREITKWNTPLDIYLEKISTEEPEEEEDDDDQRKEWGNLLEPLIVAKFERKHNVKCKTGFKDAFLHPKYPFMRANIDGKIIGEDAILECKTADKFVADGWSNLGGDNIPYAYLLQCAFYAEVVGVSKVYIAVLIGGNDFRVYQYDRNPALGELILSKVIDFWENYVLKRIPPAPIKIEDALKLWGNTESTEIKTADERIMSILKELGQIKAHMSAAEAQFNIKRTELYSFMQEAQQVNSPSGAPMATWKTQATKRFDTDAFKAEHPDLHALYIKTSQTRVLRLKGERE